jgi:hypothetical protein
MTIYVNFLHTLARALKSVMRHFNAVVEIPIIFRAYLCVIRAESDYKYVP